MKGWAPLSFIRSCEYLLHLTVFLNIPTRRSCSALWYPPKWSVTEWMLIHHRKSPCTICHLIDEPPCDKLKLLTKIVSKFEIADRVASLHWQNDSKMEKCSLTCNKFIKKCLLCYNINVSTSALNKRFLHVFLSSLVVGAPFFLACSCICNCNLRRCLI